MRAFPVSVVLASFLSFTVARAEVVAVCGTPAAPETASYGSAAKLIEAAPKAVTVGSQLALWRDEKGFDVLLNWGRENQRSLRGEGAEIMGDELEPDLIHVVIARAGENGLEHFLFSWDGPSLGELLWSAPDDAGGGSDLDSHQMACIKPSR